MFLYDTGKAFVKLDGDTIEIKGRELSNEEFRTLYDAVGFALSLLPVYISRDLVMPYPPDSPECSCCYFLVRSKGLGKVGKAGKADKPGNLRTVGAIFLTNSMEFSLSLNLATGEIKSEPQFLAKASRLLVSGFGDELGLPNISGVNAEEGSIEFHEFHGGFYSSRQYVAILHTRTGELEYPFGTPEKHDKDSRAPGSAIFRVRDVVRNGKPYLLFKEALHPYGRVYYNLKTGEIRYDGGYGNRVAEFWRKVRGAGLRVLGDDVQLKVMEMLKAKSVEEAFGWYRKLHERMLGTLEKNEQIRRLYEELVTRCILELNGCTLAVLPSSYTTILFLHDGECDVLTLEKAAGGKSWVKRKRDVYKVLRRLLDGNVGEAILAAEESGALKLDEGAAGKLLAEEFRKIRKRNYSEYSELKSLPDRLLQKLPSGMRASVLAGLI